MIDRKTWSCHVMYIKSKKMLSEKREVVNKMRNLSPL